MKPAQLHIRGTPYVPGLTAGVLRHSVNDSDSESILAINQQQITEIRVLPAGFIVVDGAPFSHRMIGLLSYGIPTVIVPSGKLEGLSSGVMLWIDGATGRISSVAMEETQSTFTYPTCRTGDVIHTVDGVPVSLRASVRSIAAAEKAMQAGFESIGLVRSEFFYPQDGSFPDNNYYYRVFSDLCEAVKPAAVTIRLLDIASDKILAGVLPNNVVGGVLGLQGARLYTTEPVQGMVNAQLDAIRRLLDHYTVRILIPYLTNYDELAYWINYVRQIIKKPVEIGAMVEVPAGALDMNNWLGLADFVAIGCNDLMQCLFAADRDRAELGQYLDPYAPVLYRFLKSIAPQNEHDIGRVQVCGVLSQLPGVLPVLIGLGYRVFSIDAALIPYQARNIRSLSILQAEELADHVCMARGSRDVQELLLR